MHRDREINNCASYVKKKEVNGYTFLYAGRDQKMKKFKKGRYLGYSKRIKLK